MNNYARGENQKNDGLLSNLNVPDMNLAKKSVIEKLHLKMIMNGLVFHAIFGISEVTPCDICEI